MKTAIRLSLVVALLLATAAAFWWLDFRAIRSRTQVESSAAAIRFGQGDPQWPRDRLAIYPEGGHLAAAIADSTARYLATQAGFSDVEVVHNLSQANGHPAIVIAIERDDGLWTPLYAHTSLRVTADYASDGDLSWRGQSAMVTGNAHPGVWVDGSIELSATTWGLSSHRGYESYLSLCIAAQLATALQGPMYETGYSS
jgi:hypothetical protein